VKLLLVDNLVLPDAGDLELLDVHPNLGLLSLGAVARGDGHEVEIYDPKRLIRSGALPYDGMLYERAAADLLGRRPGAVGFTTLGCSFLFALNVAAEIKRREPDLPILLGGPHATMLSREILERFPQFDVIARHEAEQTLPQLLAGLDHRAFDRIPGVCWRAPGGVRMTEGMPRIDDLDSLPIVSYDLYPVESLGLDLLRVEAGRGCPFLCTFCSTASFFQRRYRLKSAPRLVEELDRLHARYGFIDFKLDHDLFTVDRRKILTFCEAVRDRGYRWRVSARVDCVDDELLERMAEAGCVDLYFGIETGSARMQEVVKKRLDLGLVAPTLQTTERLQITTTVSFITGYPEEREEDLDATLDLLGECFTRPAGTNTPQLHALSPEPGTPLFTELGARMEYDGYTTPYNARLLGDGDLGLVRSHPEIFASYYYYPAALPREVQRFAVDAVDVLWRLGSMVLSYALRHFGSRLSALVGRLRRWAEREGRLDGAGEELVIDFLEAELGAGHHLASLCRYAFCVDALSRGRAPVAEPAAEPPDQDQLYVLPPWSRLFGDLHDCGELMRRIRGLAPGAPPLDEAQAGLRGPLLVTVGQGAATNFRLDDAGYCALSLFARPRSCRDAGAELGRLTGGPAPDLSLFAPLIDLKLLVPSSPARHG
jgi:radical SAM superfamily enzyme YgiQ (UPF0313 family)